MNKRISILFLIIFCLNFLTGSCDTIDPAESNSIYQLNQDQQELHLLNLIEKNEQLIMILKYSLILIILFCGLCIYLILFKKKKSNNEIEKRKYLEKDFSAILKQRDARINEQEKDFAVYKQQLLISRERYKTLVDNLHEGMVVVDAEENFLFVNKYALDIYGCKEEEILGHNVSEFTDANEFNRILHQTSIRKKGVSSKYETVIRQPNGEKKTVKISASPIIEKGKFNGSVGVFMDITEQSRNETIQEVIYNISNAVNTTDNMFDLYKKIHKDLGVVIDTTNFYIALYDSKTNIIHAPYYVDQMKKEIPKPQVMGKGLTAHVIHSGKSLYLTEEKRNELINAGEIGSGEWKSKIWLGVPLRLQDAVIGAIAVQSYENSEQFTRKDLWLLEFVSDQIALAISRKRAEKALKESEAFNRAIIENSPLAISARDNKGRLLVANKAWKKLWNKSDSDLELDFRVRKELKLDERDDYLREFRSQIKKIYLQGGELYIPELKVVKTRSTNDTKWISQYFYAIKNESDLVERVIIITEDITERKFAQVNLEKSLAEKEVLLKEVHHRVKNNMQVISSILKLQSRYIKDEQSLELFQECQNRVKSMALIHEKLYQSESFEKIDFDQYIKVLTKQLFRSFSNSGCIIRTYIDSNNVKLTMTKAIPCGLIINELVSNSLKHAFKGRKEGEIKLTMNKTGENYSLDYSDNGVGFPPDLDFRNTDSLGMQLIYALSNQLHGEITLSSINGTEIRLIFPEKIPE